MMRRAEKFQAYADFGFPKSILFTYIILSKVFFIHPRILEIIFELKFCLTVQFFTKTMLNFFNVIDFLVGIDLIPRPEPANRTF